MTPIETRQQSFVRHGYIEIPMQQSPLSMKLEEIFRREFHGSALFKSHRAEDDCLMLLSLIKQYLPDWFEWIETETLRQLSEFHRLPLKDESKIKKSTEKILKPPLKF